MKKGLFLLTVVVMVLAFCLTLSACGGDETATTTTSADTTLAPAVTTPVVTTEKSPGCTEPAESKPAVTTPVTTPVVTVSVTTTPAVTMPDNTPDVPMNVGISYSYFFSGFLYTVMDENGLTLKRELYKPDTMQKPDSFLAFYYEYDENGKLTSYTSNIYGEKSVGTVTWDTDGQTAIVTDTATGEETTRILFEIDGVLISETWLDDGTDIFYFEYDENGRLFTEMIPGEMELTVVTAYEGNEANLLFEVMYNKVAHWLITYNDAGYPITLDSQIEGDEAYFSYEYDDANRCTVSSAVVEGTEEFYYYTYDKQGRLEKVEFEGKHSLKETVYTYNEKNQKIRVSVTQTSHSGEFEECYVSEFEYTENGDLVEETISHYNASGEVIDREVIDHTA